MGKQVRYHGQPLTLRRFWANNEPCLWTSTPDQRSMPRMAFVGGYPNEYCIFLKTCPRRSWRTSQRRTAARWT